MHRWCTLCFSRSQNSTLNFPVCGACQSCRCLVFGICKTQPVIYLSLGLIICNYLDVCECTHEHSKRYYMLMHIRYMYIYIYIIYLLDILDIYIYIYLHYTSILDYLSIRYTSYIIIYLYLFTFYIYIIQWIYTWSILCLGFIDNPLLRGEASAMTSASRSTWKWRAHAQRRQDTRSINMEVLLDDTRCLYIYSEIYIHIYKP